MEEVLTLTKSHTFTMTPNSIVNDPRLSLADKGLALILHSKPEGWVYHTKHITSMSSNGLDATKSSLKRLEDAGYIKRRRKHGEDGKIVGIEIVLLNEPKVEKPSMENPSEVKSLGGKIPPYSNTDSLSNTDYKSPLTPQGEFELALEDDEKEESVLGAKGESQKPTPPNGPATPSPKSDEGFEEFWAAYPKCERKVGKAKCLEVWKRDSLAKSKDKVLKALNQDKTSQNWTKENGRWIPMPTTWLNRKRHLDVEDEAPKAEPVEMWSVLTIEDSTDIDKHIEWRAWIAVYAFDKSEKAPEWSLKTGGWVKANRHLIEIAQKLDA